MRVIIATCAGLIALSTISAQAAPLPLSKAVPTELTVSPIVPAANGFGPAPGASHSRGLLAGCPTTGMGIM